MNYFSLSTSFLGKFGASSPLPGTWSGSLGSKTIALRLGVVGARSCSAPDVDTLQASPNPITAAAPGLKRPSGEGGKDSSSSHIENMPL
ncbi:E3 ubiquitin-protein ligase HUWE1 [Dissostichus eleginoides]|uniref:E3 ubiquitin-protein ligase HUWE1 n=1 Tax=Dissostichus eleginoides TaxID=100907 RepID=A0AAD9F8N4_DISEL|nr:E3 ubiquitin-protein ligase HUWE1 [Dissostichus eleginoides]